MKISIITVCYNSKQHIASCIKSVLDQSYPNIEYIIVDGNSSDGTQEILKGYGDKIDQLIIEKDDGIYFAMNKGLSLATGDVIGFLNSDDFYADNNVIQEVADKFSSSKIDCLYGDLQYVSQNPPFKVIRHWKAGEFRINSFLKGWMPPHPTFFAKKEIYENHGVFNTKLRSAADYELMLRFLYRHKVPVGYLPRVLVKMRVGGESNKSIRNRIKANKEDRMAWEINGLRPKFYTTFYKPISKIFQYFKRG